MKDKHKKPELSEEKKAEIKAKLDAMTEEEKKEWLVSHRHKKSNRAKKLTSRASRRRIMQK